MALGVNGGYESAGGENGVAAIIEEMARKLAEISENGISWRLAKMYVAAYRWRS
jgi:enoyl reductase-like protein